MAREVVEVRAASLPGYRAVEDLAKTRLEVENCKLVGHLTCPGHSHHVCLLQLLYIHRIWAIQPTRWTFSCSGDFLVAPFAVGS